MRRIPSPAAVAALGAAIAMAGAPAAQAQTVTNTVPQVTTSVPEVPRPPATPSVPGTNTDNSVPSTPSTPSTPTPPKGPTGKDEPRAPSAQDTAEEKQKDLSRQGVEVPANPVRPGQSGDRPSRSSNGGGPRSGSDGGGSSTGSDSRSSGGGDAAGDSRSSTPAQSGNGGRGAAGGRSAGGPGLRLTEANWLDLGLDPRYERDFTRRLRKTVVELERCLYLIGRRDRRVLSLRAGLGGGARRSRAAVAQRLDLTRAGVAATEQGALRDLLGAARSGACGQDAVTVAGATASAGTPAGMGGGWAIDRLRFGSLAPSGDSVRGGASAVASLGPALLDADPFSRVSVVGSASSADPGARSLGPGSWLEAVLAALLVGLLGLLAWLVATRARRAFRHPQV